MGFLHAFCSFKITQSQQLAKLDEYRTIHHFDISETDSEHKLNGFDLGVVH